MTLDSDLWTRYTRLKNEHMADRDNRINNEACRNCNYVYNSRAVIVTF